VALRLAWDGRSSSSEMHTSNVLVASWGTLSFWSFSCMVRVPVPVSGGTPGRKSYGGKNKRSIEIIIHADLQLHSELGYIACRHTHCTVLVTYHLSLYFIITFCCYYLLMTNYYLMLVEYCYFTCHFLLLPYLFGTIRPRPTTCFFLFYLCY